MTHTSELQAALAAAVSAGNLLLDYYDEKLAVSTKESMRDIATEVDRLAEERIIKALREQADPDIAIFTEEQGRVGDAGGSREWFVDALDGTVNYVNRIPFFSVSVALALNGHPEVGVVYNPMVSDLYYAATGIGVFKNQMRLSIRDKVPEECLFAVAFSGKTFDPARRGQEFQLLGEVNDASRGCLRTGSAAMNLAYVAEGRLGGCWGKANKFWDVAAGLLLAELAGARVQFRHVDGEQPLVNYLATVPSAWDFIYERAQSALALKEA
ncbi:MAG TPA: inositol monophosphatase family protein [Solirubrobacteraceae bacterium]|nr:inositol monophosphatase family protein [Solirubrobacteraceae bacterium]